MKLSPKKLLIIIIAIAIFFRFYNVNWDQNQHLHPDERFLTMVGNAMKLPSSFSQYLDPHTSLFNPENIGFKFFVYGTFPVVLNKLLAIYLSTDTYNAFTLQGRALSAFFDILTILIIFKLLLLIKKYRNLPEQIVYLGPIFYALFVLPIQLSHFFTVDIFFNFFLFTSFYFSLKFYYEKLPLDIVWSAVFVGLGTASKLNALVILPLLLAYLIMGNLKNDSKVRDWSIAIIKKLSLVNTSYITIVSSIITIIIFSLAFYLTLRLAEPYYFADSNIFHISPSPLLLKNMKTLKYYMSSEALLPPSVQWAHTSPILFSLYNIAVWGMGIIAFMFSLLGIRSLFKKFKHIELLIAFTWALFIFLYQSVQFVKTMRYFIILYPYLAILGAFGFYYTFHHAHKIIKTFFIAALFFFPLCFLSIYIQPMSRIAASQWIIHNIPQGSIILTEHWDDSLPLPLKAFFYPTEQLPVFDPDNEQKWTRMRILLAKGDYLILSSKRGWGSIPNAPERYPLMSKFYNDLFTGALEYKKIKEFTSYPSLNYLRIPISFPDDNADEAFAVYDHPKVIIFQKQK